MKAYAVVLDFETSGFDSGSVPTQLAYQTVDRFGRTLSTKDTFIRGASSLDQWVKDNASHITLDKCNAAPDLETVLDEMFALTDDNTLLICHNTEFDLKCIQDHAPARISNRMMRCESYCTMKSTTDLCRIPARWGGYKWPKLQELAAFLGVEQGDMKAHDASDDVELTRRCLVALCCKGGHSSVFDVP